MQDKVDRVKVKERKKDHKFIKTRVFIEMEKERESCRSHQSLLPSARYLFGAIDGIEQ